MSDPYDLRRFILGQDRVYDDAIGKLRRGVMCANMELIFPRLASRDDTQEGRPYGLNSLDEASAYLSSRILGGRYRECVGALQRLSGVSVYALFGEADARKLHASLTLFSAASNDEFLLETMFDVWFGGTLDEETMIEVRRLPT